METLTCFWICKGLMTPCWERLRKLSHFSVMLNLLCLVAKSKKWADNIEDMKLRKFSWELWKKLIIFFSNTIWKKWLILILKGLCSPLIGNYGGEYYFWFLMSHWWENYTIFTHIFLYVVISAYFPNSLLTLPLVLSFKFLLRDCHIFLG